MLRVGNAAIYGADSGALRLFVEANAFGTFIGYDVVVIIRDRHLFHFCVNRRAVAEFVHACDGRAIVDCPLYATLVDSIVRAFGFARATVDTLIGYHYCHNSSSNFKIFIKKGDFRASFSKSYARIASIVSPTTPQYLRTFEQKIGVVVENRRKNSLPPA
jgi:hypothetical protein